MNTGSLLVFANLFPPIAGRKVTPPSWLRRPGPPSQLRETPCHRAAPGLFDAIPSTHGMGKQEKEDRRRQVAYAVRYCNGTETRPACPFRDECLSWALEAQERVVAGGVEVTLAMILRYHKAKREAENAPGEAQAS
jgi:hypothetical protein